MKRLRSLRKLLSLSLLAFAAPSNAVSLELKCSDPTSHGWEAAAIQQLAAGVVKRTSTHTLTVRTDARTLSFADESPYGEGLDGVEYHFCDRREGFVLLWHTDQDIATGVLIDERSGRMTSGGHVVLFSQDRRAYWTSIQPNGLDGAVWKVHALDGTPAWSGFDFQLEPGGSEVDVSLMNPSWTASGELVAVAHCAWNSAITWKVKLVKSGGEWSWRPRKNCGPREGNPR